MNQETVTLGKEGERRDGYTERKTWKKNELKRRRRKRRFDVMADLNPKREGRTGEGGDGSSNDFFVFLISDSSFALHLLSFLEDVHTQRDMEYKEYRREGKEEEVSE